ncbi:MAG: carbohydrate-binding domain-containing protein [Lachnospiraceae bacterium]|nr:carbohydrate-binding domain-containing protein [Lachnospiraceae bacterium]
MKRKKWLPLLISACMILGGCGKTSDAGADDTAVTDQEESSAAGQNGSEENGIEKSMLIVTADMADFKEDDSYTDWKNGSYTEILLNGNSAKADGKGTGTTISDGVITINQSGTYVFSGTLDDGQIVVGAADEEKVRIVLNGAEVTCSDGPAIVCTGADKLTISLENDTENVLTDGSEYVSEDYTAAIYSKADLVLNGSGMLTINANYNNGIQSKDDLRILEGSYSVNSIDDGLVGKDKVAIKDGTFSINAGGDGIKATNTEDAERGFIYIGNGTYTIVSGTDGVQAETGMLIENGVFTINSGNDSITSNGTITVGGGEYNLSAGDDAVHADSQLVLNDGNFMIPQCVEGLESADLIINGGTYDITASDDAINGAGGETDTAGMDGQMPDGTEFPENGQMPDGAEPPKEGRMRGNTGGQVPEGAEPGTENQIPEGVEPGTENQVPEGMELRAEDQLLDVTKLGTEDPLPEGTEPGTESQKPGRMWSSEDSAGKDFTEGGAAPEIPQGETDGTQRSWNQKGMGGRGEMGGGKGMMSASSGTLTITGGTIVVHSEGDGIDVNGSTSVTGGKIIVEGSTSSGNSALDYDGTFVVDGGELIAVGSSGMMQTLSKESKVPFITVVFQKMQAGQTVAVKDVSGNVIMEYTPSKAYESLIFASDDLEEGKTYQVYAGNTLLAEAEL